ncbi:dienelactone hydrolase [Mucidula mucida]|nr:dienelactone hydrolase [Mucidula mucida]
MLITKTEQDLPTTAGNGSPMRVFVLKPDLPNYPQAKFPGASEIYQVTGPVERFAGQIASRDTSSVFLPSSFHEFQGPEAIPYDDEGTDRGNRFKIEKEVAAYDEDAKLAIDVLIAHPNCNGRIAAFYGVAAFDPRVLSAWCWFATDIHSATIGKGKQDDSLIRVRSGALTDKEVVMVFGKQDTHVPRAGRDLIRKELEDAKVISTFLEVQAQHAFVRDEASKGRWDAALTRSLFGLMIEVFQRTAGRDLGPKVGTVAEPEHVC